MKRPAAAVLCLLAGCASHPPSPRPAPETVRSGDVGMQMVAPAPGTSRMALAPSQRFVFPNLMPPVAMPLYPQALLAARLGPQDVCVEADIGADGTVVAARPRTGAECASDPIRQEFVQAAIDAVKQWRFDPAVLCVAPDATSDDPCLHPRMVERPTAVRLSYAFRFSQRDGAPTVQRVGDP